MFCMFVLKRTYWLSKLLQIYLQLIDGSVVAAIDQTLALVFYVSVFHKRLYKILSKSCKSIVPVNPWIVHDLNWNIDRSSLTDVEIIDPDSYIMQLALL